MKSFLFRVVVALIWSGLSSLAWAQSTVSISVAGGILGGGGSARVNLTATGLENTVSFTLTWDPAVLSYVSNAAGSAVPTDGSATVTRNTTQTSAGKLGVLIGLEPGTRFTSGLRELLVVNFNVVGAGGSTTISFTDTPTARRVVDADAVRITDAVFADATITANPTPSTPVFTNAANTTFTVGQAGSFQFTAAGFPAPTFSTASTLPAGVTLSSSGLLSGTPTSFTGTPFSLSVKAENTQGNVTQAFTLSVQGAPAIATHPTDKTIVLGNSTTFTVAATGSPSPSIQWEKQDSGSSTWSVIANDAIYSGATTSILTVTATTKALNGTKVRAVASNGVTPAATSNAATLTVQYPPEFTVQPQSQTVNLGANVTFTATATGSPAPSYQWRRNGTAIDGATNASLTLNNVTGANAGTYTLVASSAIGTPAVSDAATLALNPAIGGFAPTSGTPGQTVTLTGAGFTGATAVKFSGIDATSFTVVDNYQITAVVPIFATSGVIAVTTASAGTLTTASSFAVVAGPRLVNLSHRSHSASGESAASSTFAIRGSGRQQILIRAVGPSLSAFGVNGAIADPMLTVYDARGLESAANDDWSAALAPAFSAVGAFALTTGSKDAALLLDLDPGTYTARVSGVGGASGVVLLEFFEYPTPSPAARVEYLASRSVAGTGASAAIAGFALTGTGNTTVLVRAVGAGLGIPGALANPVLTVFKHSTAVASNDNASSTNVSQATLAAVTAAVGAMPLGASDSALVLTLPAGSYTTQVTPAGTSDSGIVLTEIFVLDAEVPSSFVPALTAPLLPTAANLDATVVFAAPYIAKPAPAFQWQKDTTNLPGATNATLTLANVTSVNNGAYRVLMENSAGTLTSAVAQLDVNKAPQTITFPAIGTKIYGTDTSVTLAATSSSGLPISYTLSNPSVSTVATLSGNVLTIVNAGTITITARQNGNDDYQAAPDAVQTLTVAKGAATINLGGLNTTYDGTARPVTVTTEPSGLGRTILYTAQGGSPQSGAPTNAGSYAVSVAIDDLNYQGSINGTLVIAKATQSITFEQPAAKTYGDVPFALVGSASSGLPVTFVSSDPAIAEISGNTVTIRSGGEVTITASQNGNDNYTFATPTSRVLSIAKASATVTLGGLSHVYNGSTKSATATATPSDVTFSFTYTGTATPTTAPTNAGSYGVTANIVDSRYQGSASGTLVIDKAPQTITFAALPSRAIDQGAFNLTATASSGLTVSYSSSDSAVASVSGNTVTLVATGSTTLTATQAGNDNYLAADPVPQTLTVLAASQTLTFPPIAGKTFGNAPFAITATSNRGLLVSFASSNPNVATVDVGTLADGTTTATVTIVGAGTTTITAAQAGNSNYAAAPSLEQTLTVAKATAVVNLAGLSATYDGAQKPITYTTVPTPLNVEVTYAGSATPPANAGSYAVVATVNDANHLGSATGTLTIAKAPQTIAFTLSSPVLINAAPITLSATATSELGVTFTSSNSAVASVSGNTLTVQALGTTTITANQAGNANYLAAPAVTRTLVVNPVAPVITSIPPTTVTAIQGSQFSFGPVVMNPLSAPVTFSATGLPAGLSVNTSNGNISGVPSLAATPGAYTITLRATNATGQDERTVNLTLQPPAPVITSAAAANAVAGTSFTYNATATPATGVTFSATGLPTWLTLSGATLSGTPTAAGTHTVQLTATNVTGSVTLPLVITVTLPANAPVYSGPLNPSGTAGAPFAFTPNFGTGTTTYSMTGMLPTGLSFSSATGAITGTTTVVGNFPIAISATRAGLMATAELQLTINPAATAPVVGFPAPGNARTATVGTAFGPLALTATPAATGFAAENLPAGLTMTTAGVISGTPTAPGTTEVFITATNSAGTGPKALLVITINPHANSPVLTSPPIASGRVGEPLTYTLSASPALATTYGLSGALPTGLTFDGTSGIVSGTPAAGSNGLYTVHFVGTNANGAGMAYEVVFSIAPPLGVPVVTSNGTAAGEVGQPFSYQITGSNSPTSFGATGLPAGLSVNPANGLISGVPAAPSTASQPAAWVTATNASGTSTPKSVLIQIAPAPGSPVITSGGVAGGQVGTVLSYHITATGSPTSYVALVLPPGLTVNPGTGAITGTPTAAGVYAASIAAANTAGLGASAPLQVTIAAAATAPVITSAASATAQVGQPFVYQITTSGGTPTSYAVSGVLPAGLGLNSSTGAISGNPTTPGTVLVSLTATGAGGTSLPQPLSINVNPAAGVPVITSAGVASGRAGANFSYTISATNMPATKPFAAGTTLDAVNLPAGLAVNPSTGVIQGVPASAGTYVAGMYGTNSAGQGPIQDLKLTIEPPATAPVVNSPEVVAAQVGAAFSYQIGATNSPTFYEVLGAPAWMSLNSSTGAIAGVPVAPGTLTVQLVASNNAGPSAPRALTINIAAAANTPVITSSRTASGTVGVAFTLYQTTATPAATSYSASGLPPGLSLNPVSGAITGTPTVSGTFEVALSGVNASGPGAPVVLKIVISPSAALVIP